MPKWASFDFAVPALRHHGEFAVWTFSKYRLCQSQSLSCFTGACVAGSFNMDACLSSVAILLDFFVGAWPVCLCVRALLVHGGRGSRLTFQGRRHPHQHLCYRSRPMRSGKCGLISRTYCILLSSISGSMTFGDVSVSRPCPLSACVRKWESVYVCVCVPSLNQLRFNICKLGCLRREGNASSSPCSQLSPTKGPSLIS